MTTETPEFSPIEPIITPLAADASPAPRPAGVALIAYLLLLNAAGVAVNALMFGPYLHNTALLPGVSIAPQLQWQLFEGWSYSSIIVAIGLLRAWRWARLAYVVQGGLGFVLILFANRHAHGPLMVQLFFSLPFLVLFTWLLCRKDAIHYFAAVKSSRARRSLRGRLGAFLYVLAAVFAFWSLNAIVLGITEIYPKSLHRDKLTFLALPVILVAEWVGKTPGALSRAVILATAFAAYLMQMFLYKVFSEYAGQMGPSLWQLRNWAVGVTAAAMMLAYLQWRRGRSH
ncbi:hypothetical protein [Herbaspirillum sp. alder98]|uniref:hypothetical protein n=1 Tax=Herbaspirillum sp. alder98 TaxID=2913096 RepID=UPI001CD82A9B|nr:hypothetical protein [Herbaspirillum sp. alder98]MCA1326276.1 hypothetical protein [Herbaspirillum sp. alder98]